MPFTIQPRQAMIVAGVGRTAPAALRAQPPQGEGDKKVRPEGRTFMLRKYGLT